MVRNLAYAARIPTARGVTCGRREEAEAPFHSHFLQPRKSRHPDPAWIAASTASFATPLWPTQRSRPHWVNGAPGLVWTRSTNSALRRGQLPNGPCSADHTDGLRPAPVDAAIIELAEPGCSWPPRRLGGFLHVTSRRDAGPGLTLPSVRLGIRSVGSRISPTCILLPCSHCPGASSPRFARSSALAPEHGGALEDAHDVCCGAVSAGIGRSFRLRDRWCRRSPPPRARSCAA